MRAGRRWLLGLFGLGFLLLLAISVERVAERGRFARPFSSYGSGPEGARALYLLLGELGFSTLRWSQDLALLPRAGTLVALGSCASGLARPISRYEHEELLRWIDGGGVLLVAGARNYLPSELGIAFADDLDCAEEHDDAVGDVSQAKSPAGRDASAADGGSDASVVDGGSELSTQATQDSQHSQDSPAAVGGGPHAATPHAGVASPVAATPIAMPTTPPNDALWAVPMGQGLEGLPIVSFRKAARIEIDRGGDVQTLLGVPPQNADVDSEIVPLAVTRAYGHGRVIVLGSASMLQNAELENSEGATLIMRLLRRYGHGPLIFDEFHLGLGERRSLMQYLRQSGAMPAVCQLLLIALLALWRASARVGEVQLPLPPKISGTISAVTALGSLYWKVDDRAAALRLIARAALARVARMHGVGHLQAAALEQELTRRGATRAIGAVRTIVAAAGSAGNQPLPAAVARIDAAVLEASADLSSSERGP